MNLDDISTVQDYFVKDWAFHQVILDHSGNHYISRAVNELGFSAHRMRQTLGARATDATVAVSEHRSVLRGIETGDGRPERPAPGVRQCPSVHVLSAVDVDGDSVDEGGRRRQEE